MSHTMRTANDLLGWNDANDCCHGAVLVPDWSEDNGLTLHCSECGTALTECECGQMVEDVPPSRDGHWCYAVAGEAAFAERLEEEYR
jgi:hypothetical protein